jgi:hypothetical protein
MSILSQLFTYEKNCYIQNFSGDLFDPLVLAKYQCIGRVSVVEAMKMSVEAVRVLIKVVRVPIEAVGVSKETGTRKLCV